MSVILSWTSPVHPTETTRRYHPSLVPHLSRYFLIVLLGNARPMSIHLAGHPMSKAQVIELCHHKTSKVLTRSSHMLYMARQGLVTHTLEVGDDTCCNRPGKQVVGIDLYKTASLCGVMVTYYVLEVVATEDANNDAALLL